MGKSQERLNNGARSRLHAKSAKQSPLNTNERGSIFGLTRVRRPEVVAALLGSFLMGEAKLAWRAPRNISVHLNLQLLHRI